MCPDKDKYMLVGHKSCHEDTEKCVMFVMQNWLVMELNFKTCSQGEQTVSMDSIMQLWEFRVSLK